MIPELPEYIVDVLEDLGWQYLSADKYDDGQYYEIESTSPAGEDLCETIWVKPNETIAQAFRRHADEFDADEHAEMWIQCRGKRGVPDSVRVLIDDAEAIEKMLAELASAVEKAEAKNLNDGKVKTWRVPLTWQMYGHVDVEAVTEEEAIAYAFGPACPLPKGEYLEDSLEQDGECVLVPSTDN